MKCFVVVCALVALGCAQDAAPSPGFDMKGSFDRVDADMNGFVNKMEFNALYNSFDDDGDQMINATEFITHFTMTGMSVKGSLFIFFTMDKNGDLMINSTEVDMAFASFDTDMDTNVAYHDEYAPLMNMILDYLKLAAAAEPKLGAMFDAGDADKDGQLTGPEMWNVIGAADKDGNNMVNETEFVTFWRMHTGDNKDRAEAFFSLFDITGNGEFGDQVEKDAFFTGFDYDNSGMVSKEEFLNSMLDLFSRVMEIIQRQGMPSMMSTMFDAKKEFAKTDTDGDMQISMDENMKKFNKTDSDMNGSLDYKEYIGALVTAGFDQDTALYSFFQKDMNHDDKIDMAEMRMAFHHVDRNMDNHLDMDEYNRAFNMLHYQMSIVAAAKPKMAAMVYAADANGDDMLTKDEFMAILKGSDANGDKTLTRDEFTEFWTMHTGLSKDISEALYDIYDTDKNGLFSDMESANLFKGFDFNHDDMVSFDEYSNVMLFQFAEIMKKIGMRISMALQGNFNTTRLFLNTDSNYDGKIELSEFEDFYKMMDTNMDGKYNAEEFITQYVKEGGLSVKGALYVFFRADANQDQVLSPEEAKANFDAVDMDDNNALSVEETRGVWMNLLHQMREASMAGHALSKMYDGLDFNKDGNLTSTELAGLLSYMDNDKDGLVSEAEFIHVWMKDVGEPRDRSDIMFSLLDEDDDGFFGNDQEKLHFFDGVDYDDNDLVSKDEFLNSMLNLFSRVITEQEKLKAIVDAVAGFF